MKRALLIFSLLWVAVLVAGSVRNPDFWILPDRQGDRLLAKGQFAEAAKTYRDPWRIGLAQYRNGDFKPAVKTFARVPGAEGAFDQGNASLMHGDYDAALASYDRALGFRPGWKEAEENKALALARKAKMDDAGKDRGAEDGDTKKPDEIVFDQKGQDQKGQPTEMAGGEMSDTELQATWLRKVQTTPGDFLRAKFAYQAAHEKPAPKEVAP